MATSKDVAILAGVSHTTVSRAFRGDTSITQKTYDKIMAAAKQLNYTPNSLAAGLKRRNSKTIGYIASDITNPFFMIIAERMQKILDCYGYNMLIAFDSYDFATQEKALKSMIAAQAEAIVFTPVTNEQQMACVNNSGSAFWQLFTNVYTDLPCIRFDDFHGAYEGMRYLFECGHRNILIVGGSDRRKGYIDACNEYNIKPCFYEIYGKDRDEEKLNLINEIKKRKSTAVFVVANHDGTLCYEAIRDVGMIIPQDISLLIYDDMPWMKLLGISVISHPISKLSQLLVEQILEYITEKKPPVSETFAPFLIERNSVKKQ